MIKILKDNEDCPDCNHKGWRHFRLSARKEGGCYAQVRSDSIYDHKCTCNNVREEKLKEKP